MSAHNEDTVVEGGAQTYEGFELVGSVTEDELDKSAYFTFDDLLPQVRMHQMDGISITLNQSVQNGHIGTVHIRIIHDVKMRAYLFRKDEEGVTIFKTSAGLNVS
jgi:hypothetical protein